MVVRRNDRRRRLMNDEFVPTIDSGTPAQGADQRGTTEGVCAKRRTYASGADRRNQLRTTDLFPKRTWLIATFGLLLVSLIAAINGLALNAESWRSVIGPEGVAALQLGGTGTLASWFTCFMMVSVALVSLQIYALRRHRCDDYVGTYRMWMWFPPIFVIASLASIVDVGAIAWNIFDATLGVSLPQGSLIPLITGLVVLAALAGRVLYEVRESGASVAMLVLAWLSLAVSIMMQTEWASNQIAASDRHIVLGNSYLVSAAALLVGHLFYTRFVYLHAHGLIVKKQAKVAKSRASSDGAKAAAPSSKASAAEKKKVAQTSKAAKQTKPEPVAKKKAAVKQATAKAPVAKPATVKMTKASKGASAKPAANAKPAAAESKPATMNSFKSLLDKRKSDQQAAAAKQQQPVAEADPPATLKMSKAERKRAKKAKRAAARKAA